jgi:hypothetical protein
VHRAAIGVPDTGRSRLSGVHRWAELGVRGRGGDGSTRAMPPVRSGSPADLTRRFGGVTSKPAPEDTVDDSAGSHDGSSASTMGSVTISAPPAQQVAEKPSGIVPMKLLPESAPMMISSPGWWGTGGDVVHSAAYCFFTSQPESTDASTLDAPCPPPEPEG